MSEIFSGIFYPNMAKLGFTCGDNIEDCVCLGLTNGCIKTLYQYIRQDVIVSYSEYNIHINSNMVLVKKVTIRILNDNVWKLIFSIQLQSNDYHIKFSHYNEHFNSEREIRLFFENNRSSISSYLSNLNPQVLKYFFGNYLRLN